MRRLSTTASDLLILPGTKNTITDLKWLRLCGLDTAILRLAEGDTMVFGICGGYQMPGEQVTDGGFLKRKLFNRLPDPAFSAVAGDCPGQGFQFITGVAHGDAQAGGTDDVNIVSTVTDSNTVFTGDAKGCKGYAHPL